ncbi:uncharacterized protein lrrc41 isoform 2-T2 [Odontesthes bonariensis]|uniref:uncharacterized protein lrrc41 isoform X2 n=1 Tax=Odontesthes bonariensis TaxID=219752 RepID=UPI003F58900A
MFVTAERRDSAVSSLKELSLRAVSRHSTALRPEAVLDLPAVLIKDLLPHLTVCQLDEVQPALNQRGISTHSGWIGFLQDMHSPKHAIDFHTEDEAKHEVMRILFPQVFYGFRNNYVCRNLTHLNTSSFLWAAAKCIEYFSLITSSHRTLQSLTAEQRPLLKLLEMRIKSVGVSDSIDLSKKKTQTALYILHRLLDHGVATKLVLHHVTCPIMLAWLLHGRGSQYVNLELKKLMHSSCMLQTTSAHTDGASSCPDLEIRSSDDQDDQVSPCKRSKLDSVFMTEVESGKANFTVDPQALCQTFAPCEVPSAGVCSWGQIHSLEIRRCGSDSLQVLNSALPTFFCLRSLTLHSISTFRESDVLCLAAALKQLSDTSRSFITDLNISVLPTTKLMEKLLDASPSLTSLHVEIQTVVWESHNMLHHPWTAESHIPVLPLQKLEVKVAELQTDLCFLTCVLKRCPHLTSLHLAGLRLPTGSSQSQLLTTLSESNHCLRILILECMKLSDCLPEILDLLKACRLEELRFSDCRLLESCSDKEESLLQLVAALKKVPSLHTLSLAQNRLAPTSFSLPRC